MKNSPSVNSPACNTPKTPGGISRALLTPCRRVGLSRNWKKKGPSPFISPLASENNGTVTPDKARVQNKTSVNSEAGTEPAELASDPNTLTSTPKSVQIPRKSKSRGSLTKEKLILNPPPEDGLLNQDISIEKQTLNAETYQDTTVTRKSTNDLTNATGSIDPKDLEVSNKSTNSNKNTTTETSNKNTTLLHNDEKKVVKLSKVKSIAKKEISPNKLTKECIVVIQKKLEPKKNEKSKNTSEKDPKEKENKTDISKTSTLVSQALFDSDSDDVPLGSIKKQDLQSDNTKKRPRQILADNDDDLFEDNKNACKVKKLEHKNTSTPKVSVQKLENKNTSTTDLNNTKNKKKNDKKTELKPKTSSQNSEISFDDDDFDFSCKKTILIKKCYGKVAKPSRAKSTGSITQRDIDELKARIEMKKNLLLTKTMTKDTAELRSLIKKWRKGCQEALAELMDLMKTKFPDRQNMDYSEILQTLRIPSALVGYDSDNDCFESPDDAAIILSHI